MRDFGFLIWAIVVIAGVISSIAQNARKRTTSSPASTAAAASPQRMDEMRRLAQAISVRVDPSGRAVPPARQARVLPASGTASPASAAPPQRTIPAGTTPVSPSVSPAPGWPAGIRPRPSHRALERLFANRHALADAVVAAEVLGKPIALRNEYADR